MVSEVPRLRTSLPAPAPSLDGLAWPPTDDVGGRKLTPQAFERAVAASIPDLLRAAKSILSSEDEAWDAVQETLLRVWLRGWLPERPTAALVHLTVLSSLHLLRCGRRRARRESEHAETSERCCDEDPLAALESDERARTVREAVRSLAEEHRAVLELFEFEGASYASIAERLDVPIGTVRSRLNRGRALLRQRLLAKVDAA